MSFADIKDKMTEITNNLYEVLSNAHTEIENFNNNINSKLRDQYHNSLNILKEIENKLFDNENKVNEDLDKIKAIITNLHEELKAKVEKHKKTHVLEDAKTSLFNAREENLKDFINSKKRKISEINQKIKYLDNQCLLMLKQKNQEIIEAEKKHKARLQELDRKTKFETEKIEEDILTPGPHIKTGANDIEKLSKEEVIKIRINGINEIKNVKVKYASIKKFESIKHLEFVINTKKDNEILREEYNQQIEKLKYLKIKEQRELEKGLDSYNFNVYHQLNELEKTYNLEENKIIDKYYQQIADYQKQMFLKMKEKQKQKNEDVSLIHLQIKDLDNLNLNEYLDALKRNLNHSKQSFYTYHKFFLEVITLFQEKLISLVNNLNRELNTLDNYKYLLSTTYKQTYSFEYSEYQGNLEKITEKFINNQKQTEKEFLKLLESNFDAILNAIKNLVNNFELFVKEQTNNINKFYNDLFGLVNLVFSDSTKLKEEQFASDALITNESINKMKAEMDNLINELEEKNSNVFTEYQNKNLSLKERIKEYNISLKKEQKKELAQYNNAIKNIKNNISKIKRKYRKEKQEARKEINRKFNQDIKEFEQEKKTKLKIGQI